MTGIQAEPPAVLHLLAPGCKHHLVQSSSIPAPECTPQMNLEKQILRHGNKDSMLHLEQASKENMDSPIQVLQMIQLVSKSTQDGGFIHS